MPVLQTINLVLFYSIASHHFLYNYALLIGCFYVGLLGGSVYVHGYSRIQKDLPVSKREFALASGIIVADISGLFIQACLYSSNQIDGAVAVCPR
jgi:battenin